MSRKVLYINTPTYIGGAEISLLTLMRHLEADRYKPLLVTSSNGQLVEAAQDYGIETLVQEFPWFRKRYPWRYPISVARLAHTVRKHEVSLIHTNCDHSLPYVKRAARIASVPYVSHVRDLVRCWFQPRYLNALQRATRVVANSRTVAQECVNAGLDQGRVIVIYNPISLPEFELATIEDAHTVRKELGIAPEAIVIGMVGQIQPIKGHQEFVEAALMLASHKSDVHFMIVGAVAPGESNQQFMATLQHLVAASKYPGHFHFLGFRCDIPAIMKALDILAVPSWNESFGRVAVEGMMAGSAVVASRAGGLPEIVVDGENGRLIEPGDVQALQEALSYLIDNPAVRLRYAANGRQSAQRFGVEQHVRQIQALYDQVLSTTKKSKLDHSRGH